VWVKTLVAFLVAMFSTKQSQHEKQRKIIIFHEMLLSLAAKVAIV